MIYILEIIFKHINNTARENDSVWPDVWPQNKSTPEWSIFIAQRFCLIFLTHLILWLIFGLISWVISYSVLVSVTYILWSNGFSRYFYHYLMDFQYIWIYRLGWHYEWLHISWWSVSMVQLFYLISNTMSLICIILKLMIFADISKDIILTLGQCDPHFLAQRFFPIYLKLLHELALDPSHTNGLTLWVTWH